MGSLSYAKRRNGIYYFRRRVPRDIQAIIGLSEVLSSLRTSCPRQARLRSLQEALRWEMAFEQARQRILGLTEDTGEMAELAVSAYTDRLWYYKAILDEPAGAQPGQAAQLIRDISQQIDQGLTRDYWGSLDSQFMACLDRIGHPVEYDTPAYIQARRTVAQAFLKAGEDALKYQAGEFALPVEVPAIATPVQAVTSAAKPKGPLLSEIYLKWQKERERPQRTVQEWDRALGMFIEHIGDLPVDAITKEHAYAYKDMLLRLPKDPGGKYRQLSLEQKLKIGDAAPRSARLQADTIKKYMAAVRSVLEEAKDREIIQVNPFSNIEVADTGVSGKDRQPFNKAQLKIIFDPKSYLLHCRENIKPANPIIPSRYWCPLIALFTGARQTELTQLTTKDVRNDGDIWFIDINARGETKSVKTASSRRQVPIHAQLIDLGFIEYVQSLPEGKVFPEIEETPRSKDGGLSNWWGRYLNFVGLDDPSYDFHSFRHTFKDAARDAEVAEDVSDAITGHSGAGQSVGRRYGKVSLEAKAKAIAKIMYTGLNLSSLMDGK